VESEGRQSAITEQRKAQRAPAAAGSTASGLDDLFNRLRSSPAGLTAAEAARRVKEAGPNDPAATKQGGPLAEFLRFCASPLVIILFVASVTAALLGQVVDASIIAVMVLLSVILNFMQAYRSEREVERLRERVAPTATVLRDAVWSEIPRRDLVPGDILRLCAGDLVPADARLIQSRDLHVQEAALTGESTPAEKSAAEQKSEEPSALAANMVFLGTSVVSGTATALVVATGKATAFGDIVLRLALRRPETEFDRGIRQFGILILETVTFLVLFIMLVNIAMHRDALESLCLL
jgi:Mg2+-importing ATPase